MGNRKKIGTRRSCYKKKRDIGKSKSIPEHQTPVSSVGHKPTDISSSKLKLNDNFSYYYCKTETLEYEIIDINLFGSVLSELAVCRFCHETLHFSKKSLSGLATQFRIFCKNCEHSDKTFVNCEKICIVDDNSLQTIMNKHFMT